MKKTIFIVGFIVLGIGATVLLIRSNEIDNSESASTETAEASETVASPEKDDSIVLSEPATVQSGPKLAFELADEELSEENSLWLESEYIPKMDLAEFHIRSTFVTVDPTKLKDELEDAYAANGGFIEPGTNLAPSDIDFIIPLFPDVSVRATLVHFKVGRHSGLITARFKTIANETGGLSNTDNIYFEIGASGEVSGIVDTPEGMFRIRPTPTLDLLVVSELDSLSVYGALKVD